MGKKKRLIMKRRKFGRKHANHPVLKARATTAGTSEPEPVVEQEPVVEEDDVATSNAYVSTTDDADVFVGLLQELQEGRELPVRAPEAPAPAPVVKRTPAKRKPAKKFGTTKRSKRATVKKDK
tara:strand:+ start:430 stop:798 length:369 start_codon:yes stop_codon:yes gene_type:complete